MYCHHCQQETAPDHAKFCPHCGNPFAPLEQSEEEAAATATAQGYAAAQGQATPATGSITATGFLSGIAGQIHRAAGVDSPTELKLKEIFSNVTKKHTEDDAERLFIAGTSATTPPLELVGDSWPKPWLFSRVFLMLAITYVGLYLGFDYFQNHNFLPGLIIVGSFCMPVTLLTFFWEMNVMQNISFYRLVKMLLIGGVLSLVATIFIFGQVGSAGSKPLVIGIIEEIGKVVAVLYFLRENRYNTILNGLLVGAAIGAGFAAFESAGYALNFGLQGGSGVMYEVIYLRALLSLGGHVLWAALAGAAICLVKGTRPFDFSMLKDMRFLRVFAIVIILHAVWDWPIPLLDRIPFYGKLIGLTVIAWVIAFAFIQMGLKEINRIKSGQRDQFEQQHVLPDSAPPASM